MDELGFIAAFLVLGLVVGAWIGWRTGSDDWHTRNCITQFYHAQTSADSLLIIQDDKFCARVVEKTK